MTKTILFVDPANYRAYDGNTLNTEGLGGTEATIVRVATTLANHFRVVVAHNHRNEKKEGPVTYISLSDALTLSPSPEVIIMVRKYQRLPEFTERYPSAKTIVWLHTRPKRSLRKFSAYFLKHKTILIGVSHYHAGMMKEKLKGSLFERTLDLFTRKPSVIVNVIYNPIADDLAPDNTPVDANKLLFLSSPSRGLSQVLSLFEKLRSIKPSLKLYLAEPGYRIREDDAAYHTAHEKSGVELLGPLSHSDVIKQMRSAFCVFFPQTVLPETFGLIYAEANAVGTPVLAHDFGSAREVLNNNAQLVNGANEKNVIDTFIKWQDGKRPSVTGKTEHHLSHITAQWKILCEEHA